MRTRKGAAPWGSRLSWLRKAALCCLLAPALWSARPTPLPVSFRWSADAEGGPHWSRRMRGRTERFQPGSLRLCACCVLLINQVTATYRAPVGDVSWILPVEDHDGGVILAFQHGTTVAPSPGRVGPARLSQLVTYPDGGIPLPLDGFLGTPRVSTPGGRMESVEISGTCFPPERDEP